MNILHRLAENRYIDIIEYLNLRPQCYGKENKDKLIYYICENNKDLGFFAMYRYWIEYLYLADICGYIPVIYAGNDCAYREEKRFHGTKNSFEYYFVQPTEIKLHQLKESCAVIHSQISHRQIVEIVYTGNKNNYLYTHKYLQAMSEIVKKYIKFNDITQQFIENGIKKINLSENKVLGVHIRGTDFRASYNNHPVFVTSGDCFSVIDKYLDKYDKIFVATDDKRILHEFIKKYGDRMCYYEDVARNDKNVSVVFEKKLREYHKYRLGIEVLRDMYTLALCDGLVAGISQVAVCAQINKLAMGGVYDDLKIINKGIYRNSRKFKRH